MSDSIRANQPINAEETSTDRIGRLTPLEWLLSLVLHVVVGALLIWITLGQGMVHLVNNPGNSKASSAMPKSMQNPQQIQEVVQDIEKRQSENAVAMVSQLLESEKQLNDLTKKRVDTFNKEATSIASTAPATALDQLKKIPDEQEAALQDQRKLADQVAALAAKIDDVQKATTTEAIQAGAAEVAQAGATVQTLQNSIKQNQIATDDAQTQATQALNFVAPGYADTLDAQKKATEAQGAASDSQQKALDLQNQVLTAFSQWKRQALAQAQVEEKCAQLQSTINQLTQNDGAAATQALDAANAKLAATTQAAKDAQSQAAQSKTDADVQLAQAAKAAVAQAKTDAGQARTASSRVALELMRNQGRLAGQQKALQRATTATALAEIALAPLLQQVEAPQKSTQDDQAAAKEQQLVAISKLEAAQQNASTQTPASPQTIASTEVESIAAATSLDGKNLAEIYQIGQAAEQRITDQYKTFRAAELASIRKVTLQEALDSTQVARPDREKLDTKLLAARDVDGNLAAYKEQVTKANQQLSSMVTLSQNMLASAQAQQNVAEGTINVSAMMQNQVAAATASDQMAGKDMTAMTQGSNLGSGLPGTEGDGLTSDAAISYARNAPELPGMDYKHLQAYSTRRINARNGVHSDWLYVDSWYVIGPFPDLGRRNLNTKYPPESIVDLNAVYPGKDDKPVHWQFLQWDSPRLRMPNDVQEAPAVYYSYTELYFDTPQDLWIASGSDDKGTMWLNDVMVWNSNDNLKAWNPNEGYRKVHFVQGTNRILYRLENGAAAAVFSLMISTKASGT